MISNTCFVLVLKYEQGIYDAFCSMALHTLPLERELLLSDLLLTTERGGDD